MRHALVTLAAAGGFWLFMALMSGSDPLPEPDVPYVNAQIEAITGLTGVQREAGWLFDCSFGEIGNYAFRSSRGARGVLCTTIGGHSQVRYRVFMSSLDKVTRYTGPSIPFFFFVGVISMIRPRAGVEGTNQK